MKTFSILIAITIFLTSLIAMNVGTVEASELMMRTDLSWSHASFIGEKEGDNSGYSISILGDVNGDGFDDLLITATANDEGGDGAGQVYLFLGEGTGWSMDIDLSMADASYIGEDVFDYIGTCIAGAGDVNRDGYDDFLISACYDNDGGANTGQTYLILGKAAGWSMDTDLSMADASFIGEADGDNSGQSVAGAGDVNGDGYDDFLISSRHNDEGGTSAGQTYLIFGRSSGWSMDMSLSSVNASFIGEDAQDLSGSCVAGVGDVDGDGYDDFIIGAPGDDDGGNNAGQTYLIFGKASAWAMDTDLSSTYHSFIGEVAGDSSGTMVAGAGDVDNDGFDDILIGAYHNSDGGINAGKTYLILGEKWFSLMDVSLVDSDASFLGEDGGDISSLSLGGGGDVNNDGYDDFLIGAPGDEDGGGYNSGQVYLIFGRKIGWNPNTPLSFADASFIGEEEGDLAGREFSAISCSGDVDGDGFDDILIGAPVNGEGSRNAGQTYLVLSGHNPPGPQKLTYSLSRDTPQITLSWESPTGWAEPLLCYRIYRSMDGIDYMYMGRTAPSKMVFTDSSVNVGITYRYRVTADYDQGSNYLGMAELAVLCDRDLDSDGIGNIADEDDDGDGHPDISDAFPHNAAEWMDTDLDGIGNNQDQDDDNDGVNDASDPAPLDPINFVMTELDLVNSAIGRIEQDILRTQTDLDDMRDELLARLTSLRTDMGRMNESTQSLLNGLDIDLAELGSIIDSDLARLQQAVIAAITQLRTDIDEQSDGTNNKFSNISLRLDQLEVMLKGIDDLQTQTSEDLDTLSDRISVIEDMTKEVDKEQESAGSKMVMLTLVSVLLLLLMLVLIALAVLNFFRGHTKEEEPVHESPRRRKRVEREEQW